MAASRVVALLRGINVAGKNMISMPALVQALEKAGHRSVETYIQSGNVFLDTDATTAEVEQSVETVISSRFGLTIPTIARTRAEWSTLSTGAPFDDARASRPKFLHVGFSKAKLDPKVVDALRAKAVNERVEVHAGALYIDFAEGAGRSKLTPAVIDKAAGSHVTLRNWNTTLELARRLG